MTPGQFGPKSRTLCKPLIYFATRIVSLTGIPSVMDAMVLMPESAASAIASAANAGGTNTKDVSAPVESTASWTVLKTGISPSITCPPFPGVTPATRFVPYSLHLTA